MRRVVGTLATDRRPGREGQGALELVVAGRSSDHFAYCPGNPLRQCGHRWLRAVQEIWTRVPASNVAPTQVHLINLFRQDSCPQLLIHRSSIRYVQLTDGSWECVRNIEFHQLNDQQRTTDRAKPASLVSLYLLFMSLAV